MHTELMSTHSLMPRSDLACHSCRKRKVKCDRAVPQCVVCIQTGQTCNYPLQPRKPGPKIGSFQKRRVSRRSNGKAQSRRVSPDRSPPTYEDRHANTLEGDTDAVGLVPTAYSETLPVAETHEDDRSRTSHLNIQDLSYILHPSHEATTPSTNQEQSPTFSDRAQGGLCRDACLELGLSQSTMNQMIRVFLDNMVAINIFHEPTFAEKLSNIPSLYQLTALLAAIVGYASRFQAPRDMRADIPPRDNEKPEHFVRRAFQYANKALVECDDEMPPLCVLQALIIATHCQLTRGVRGKAWRSLGLCVRLVYELSLHQLDSEISARPTDTQQWQADEEKRRAFWAVFEMDIFASTIRQTPTAIDWAHMEVLLPVDNANWFQGQPAPSCFMDADKNQCWKALQDSGNQSPKAWFLVINSMMKVAHYISDSQRLSAMGNSGHQQSSQRTTWVEESRQKLEKLGNAVRCFSLALPAHLRYYDQYLSFGAPVQGQLESQRQQHCSLYNIFVMTQLTRLMIHRYDAFRPQSRQSDINAGSRPGDVAGAIPFNPQDTESAAQRQYYEAADGILRIVSQSCEEHIQHINPFLSSTIWLASAVQLVRKHFARAPASRSLIKSRFDVLYLTYRRCVDFWGTQTAMQRNLESLEEQLEARKRTMDARESQSSSDQTSHVGHQKRKRTLPTMPHFTATKKPRHKQPQYIPESPRDYAEASTFVDGGTDVVAQGYARHHPDAVDSMVMLGMMPPSQDRSQTSGQYLMPPSSEFFDPAMGQAQHEQVLDWPTFDFSGGIQDLLAGWTAY